MLAESFEYDLPDELVAQHPVEPRDHSRLMVIRRDQGTFSHHRFTELPDLLRPTDVLVRNDSRVLPASLIGRRTATGGRWQGLFLGTHHDGTWNVLAKTRGRPSPGEVIELDTGLRLTLMERGEEGRWRVRPESDEDALALLDRHGSIPLPPYIRKGRDVPEDRVRYQTIFARAPGSVAAPTAGLHFTRDLEDRLAAVGARFVDLTLHVGIGTFRPIVATRIEDHVMHGEWAELTPGAAEELSRARASGGRIVAVGTTSVRTLETAARTGSLSAFRGETSLYIRPGHEFLAVDALLTNFHLPRSSLLVLVSAFAGLELIRQAYAEAIRSHYRFFSYGDAMLIV